ncbi:30S ribosomal protein S18 [Patescibacteria group bacterium]|nr:30S ribosomal protein S18 [Patescibacteria group bacterium]
MSKKVKLQKTARPELPEYIDYKDVETLRGYLSSFGRIVPHYYSGISLRQQKQLALAIKRAREMGMLPYTRKY